MGARLPGVPLASRSWVAEPVQNLRIVSWSRNQLPSESLSWGAEEYSNENFQETPLLKNHPATHIPFPLCSTMGVNFSLYGSERI